MRRRLNEDVVKYSERQDLAIKRAIVRHATGKTKVFLLRFLLIMTDYVERQVFQRRLQRCCDIFMNLREWLTRSSRQPYFTQGRYPIKMYIIVTVLMQRVESAHEIFVGI